MADKDGDEKKADEGGGGGKKKLIIIVAPVLLVVILAAVYFLVLKPSSAAPAAGAAAAAAAPSPSASYAEGPVVKSDSISINLAGGHYLKLTMALQTTPDAGSDVSAAKAMDAAIELFSNKTIDELTDVKSRDKYKQKLVDHVGELYDHKVFDLYFTEFVMQ